MTEEEHLRDLDPQEWMTVADVAQKLGLGPKKFNAMLTEAGLKWRGPRGKWASAYPTQVALDDEYAKLVIHMGSAPLTRWNLPKLRELFSELLNG